jgi:signal transduction histidine kinase
MALDYFENTELPGPARKRLDLAEQEMARINRLLADILLYARPFTLNPMKTDFCPILQNVVNSPAPRAQEKQVSVNLICPQPSLPLVADADRLQQIIINLLNNALDAAAEGSTVTVNVDATDEVLQVSVHNQGEVIPETNLERLFEPFFTTKPDGTGLGLAITRRLAQAHGGSISVQSDAKDGTCFTLRIPRMI